MSVVLSKCAECKHLKIRKMGEDLTCDAYPEGIPFEVFKSLESARCSDNISFEQCKDEDDKKAL